MSYTLQLYFDFSGYTDMAIGAALLFNIKLPLNFNSPYKALNIQDFWRRWHMTLSRFLRDYIYIPLGGNKCSESLICTNLMITFLLGGIWHGAGWNFIIWGALHGIALVFLRFWSRLQFSMHKVLAWTLTFLFVNLTWVPFRAVNLESTMKVVKGMCGLNGVVFPAKLKKIPGLKSLGVDFGEWLVNLQISLDVILYLILGLVACVAFKNSNKYVEEFRPDWKHFCLLMLMTMSLLFVSRASDFLYFNF